MPASMINAPTGSSPKVMGRSMAMVAIGPTPGSTPMSVPTRTPRKQRARLVNEKATPKPSARLLMMSAMAARSDVNDTGDDDDRDRQVQHVSEQPDAEGGHDGREDDDLRLADLMRAIAADDHRERAGDHQAEKPDGDSEGEDAGHDEKRPAKAARLEPVASSQGRYEHEEDRAVEE